MSPSRLVLLGALGALLSTSPVPAAGLPHDFVQRLNFMAQESGVPGIVEATPKLLAAGYFDRVVAEWTAHQGALHGTECHEAWCKGLDIFLTRHVDPDEATMWSVDVYRQHGPADVRLADGRTVAAFLVEAAKWRGDEHEPTTFAVVLKDGEPAEAFTRFTPVAPPPPEFADNASVAFQKRMLAARAGFPADLGPAIDAVSGFYAASPMGYLFAVGEAWEGFQHGAPGDLASQVRAKLPTAVYWWMDDMVRPMRGESVAVLELAGPIPVKIKGEIREGWVTKVRITPAGGGQAEERRLAAFWKQGLIESVTAEFEPAGR